MKTIKTLMAAAVLAVSMGATAQTEEQYNALTDGVLMSYSNQCEEANKGIGDMAIINYAMDNAHKQGMTIAEYVESEYVLKGWDWIASGMLTCTEAKEAFEKKDLYKIYWK